MWNRIWKEEESGGIDGGGGDDGGIFARVIGTVIATGVGRNDWGMIERVWIWI